MWQRADCAENRIPFERGGWRASPPTEAGCGRIWVAARFNRMGAYSAFKAQSN